MSDNAIKISKLSKSFRLPLERVTSFKDSFVQMSFGKKTKQLQALKNIGLEIKQGEFFGIIGDNGGGKSTLLKMIAGIYHDDENAIETNGKIVPFIELGVGFQPELTGRDNVYLSAALLGMSRSEVDKVYSKIVNYAELKDHMGQRLKNFSSGMQVRLAFAIAIHAKSDIMLIDEVLAVGDKDFQAKCFKFFKEQKGKKTVVFVSHNLSVVEQFCDRVALIKKGKLVELGSPKKVINSYTSK